MSYICPCCHSTIHANPSEDIVEFLPLSERQRIICRALAKAEGKYVPSATLIDLVHGHRADGGPLSAKSTIKVAITSCRRVLRSVGLLIESKYGTGYRMLQMDSSAARLAKARSIIADQMGTSVADEVFGQLLVTHRPARQLKAVSGGRKT